MCEYCKKVTMTRWGLIIDMDTVRGIYKNHGEPRYCVCTMNDIVYYIAKTLEEAEKVVEDNKRYIGLKIIDMAD